MSNSVYARKEKVEPHDVLAPRIYYFDSLEGGEKRVEEYKNHLINGGYEVIDFYGDWS